MTTRIDMTPRLHTLTDELRTTCNFAPTTALRTTEHKSQGMPRGLFKVYAIRNCNSCSDSTLNRLPGEQGYMTCPHPPTPAYTLRQHIKP